LFKNYCCIIHYIQLNPKNDYIYNYYILNLLNTSQHVVIMVEWSTKSQSYDYFLIGLFLFLEN